VNRPRPRSRSRSIPTGRPQGSNRREGKSRPGPLGHARFHGPDGRFRLSPAARE
jgi:hypothetical protein